MAEEYNAADEKQVADREKKDKNVREQELDDIKLLLKRPEGMRLFRRLMALGKVFETTYTGNSQGYFLEGHRNLALMFLHDIAEAAPHKVPELIIDKDGR